LRGKPGATVLTVRIELYAAHLQKRRTGTRPQDNLPRPPVWGAPLSVQPPCWGVELQ
ncbi:hypothetical protein MHYP_G00204390, partial [Metynnis hypsauchen]